MANHHGDFIWYELLTSDADAAQAFYGRVVGWTVADSGQEAMDYRILNAGENSVGGLTAIPPEMAERGARPAWLGYVGVDDVDKCVESIDHGGGRTVMPAMDIPNVGRIAMVADPQGARFYIMKPASVEGTSLAFAYDVPRNGHCAWNELITSDQKAAWHFYGTRFGWTKDGEMAMGPLGTYDFIRHHSPTGGVIGAVMTGTAEMGPPHWNQYFRVPDIDVAKATVESLGGTVINGPMEVPGGDFALNAIDPQGAHFGLVGGRPAPQA
ncbi:VOC family protein [Sphingobium sufflavum]|uniref:VOC family protein n=1 Tax=Sphingobium sufflavum TaxID=1129547 RepID=UPI001F1E6C77|nr:VOC family protein [Sphingobium sufflavum]MCE7795273.1 VOC family protein [Sphingobium sufflavum]